MNRTPIETFRAEARLAHASMLTHASAVANARAGFLRASRYRMRFSAPSKNYEADHTGDWNCSIHESAPIWAARREGTRVWKAGEEAGDEA